MNKFIVATMLALFVAQTIAVNCTQHYECQNYSSLWDAIDCINGQCQCAIAHGFTGNATSTSHCACLSPNAVQWENSVPYCVLLPSFSEKARADYLKKLTVQVFQLTIGSTPAGIAAGVINVDYLFNPNCTGRFNPLDLTSQNCPTFKAQLYALAANSNVKSVTPVVLLAEKNTVTFRIDLLTDETPLVPNTADNLTIVGVFYFDNGNRIIAADINLLNLGLRNNVDLQNSSKIAEIIGGACFVAINYCGFENLYANETSCLNHMVTLPIGTFDQGYDSSLACIALGLDLITSGGLQNGIIGQCADIGPNSNLCKTRQQSDYYTNDIKNSF